MYFLILVSAEKTGQVLKDLRDIKPPEEVEIHGMWSLAGRYDVALICEAPNESSALDFVVNKVKSISGVTYIETLIAKELVSLLPARKGTIQPYLYSFYSTLTFATSVSAASIFYGTVVGLLPFTMGVPLFLALAAFSIASGTGWLRLKRHG